MMPCIHTIGTLLPPYRASQTDIARQLGIWSGDRVTARLIRHVFQRSGIETRHSVIPDFSATGEAELFGQDSEGGIREASTQERNRCFARHAGRMAVQVAKAALQRGPMFRPADITHVITVSCTGFVNPGPDYQIVAELGLDPRVQRYNLGFMGCYAALPALRMAQQFCLAQPDAVVLVVCLELCSLHMQINPTPDSILANALFSDGAAAVLVSGREPDRTRPALALRHFNSAIAVEGIRDMAWEIGDKGFNLVLSSYVPDVIAANVEHIVDALLSSRGLTLSSVPLWAIHPGGRAIIDKVEASLGLASWQTEASRSVLRECGNMSSATILFVLERILASHIEESTNVAAMAFGPGLTIESALLEIVPALRDAVDTPGEVDALAACS
ncbi:MAG: type III polyketide synthase [Verrucomicrobiia bacterium]